jgi:hypothetical protein
MEEEVLTAPNNMVAGPQEHYEQRPTEGQGSTKFNSEVFFGAKPRRRQTTEWNTEVERKAEAKEAVMKREREQLNCRED